LSAQTSKQTIIVNFLFFSAYSSVIRNFVYCIRSYRILFQNIHTSNNANGFYFLSEDVSRQIVITLYVIIIDYIVILFIRNRACGK